MISCIHTWTNEVMTVHTGVPTITIPLRNLYLVAVMASALSALPGLNYLWNYKTVSSLQPLVYVLGFCFGGFSLVFWLGWFFVPGAIWVYFFFSSPKWWTLFASVWFPKISSLWSLTKSLLRTLLNCSHLCFHFAFASWRALHLCTACCSHLLDHPSYSTSQRWFHTPLPESTNFWYFHEVFVGYVETSRKP